MYVIQSPAGSARSSTACWVITTHAISITTSIARVTMTRIRIVILIVIMMVIIE